MPDGQSLVDKKLQARAFFPPAIRQPGRPSAESGWQPNFPRNQKLMDLGLRWRGRNSLLLGVEVERRGVRAILL